MHMHLTSVKKGEKLKVRGKGRKRSNAVIRWPSTTRSTKNQPNKNHQTKKPHCSFWCGPKCYFCKWRCNCVLWKWPRLAHTFKGRRLTGSFRWGSSIIQPGCSALTHGRCKPLRSVQCFYFWQSSTMTSAFAEPLNSQLCHRKWYWFNQGKNRSPSPALVGWKITAFELICGWGLL